MTIKQNTDFLNELLLGDKERQGSLRHLAFVIGESKYNEVKNSTKEQIVSMLDEYYSAPDRFNKLWTGLTNAERKIISMHIWGNDFEPLECADYVAKEFGVLKKRERLYYSYSRNGLDEFKEKYAEKNSALWLLLPSSRGDWLFSDEIRNAVGEMKREYSKVSGKLAFSSRENRVSDFLSIVRFCNSGKLSLTKSGTLSKPSAMKLRDFCGYEEFAADINTDPGDMRTTEGLLVTFPLIVLCTVGGLLAAAEGECIPGSKSVSLLDLPYEELIKKLFDAYLKSKSFDEISMMKGIRSKRGHNPAEARQNLVKELKYCPPGQSVNTKDFELYLRIAQKAFARKDEKYVVEAGSNYYNYGVDWEHYEHTLINTVISFFGALGIIDIAWGKDDGMYVDRGRRVPVAFRINPLGAYVLGLSGSYTAPVDPVAKVKGGFTVLPDYTVIVPESSDRFKHEMYFEKLFTKVSTTGEASIYRLDFETVIRALDSGASVTDLRKYLSASDKPVPENILQALKDWEKQSSRIRLRQVTILECDDVALLEEVIRYKGMGEFVKEKISAAVVVESGATNKIKKVIEKNKRFCKNVI